MSVCARVCVRVSAGFLGMCVRGGMCWGCTGFRGNLSFIQTEGACESPPEIGRQKSWRQEGRRKEDSTMTTKSLAWMPEGEWF